MIRTNQGIRRYIGRALNAVETQEVRKPKYVSSTSPRPKRKMSPIPLTCSVADAMTTLEAIIETMPGSRIVTVNVGYLHAEFRSRVFGFVDDVEFLVDEPNAVIHFRSSSRVGHSDLGVNRKRMVEIRERMESSD